MNRCGSREPLSLIGVASPAGLWETIAKTDDETTLNVIAASPLRLLFSLSILQLLVCFSKLLRTTEFKNQDDRHFMLRFLYDIGHFNLTAFSHAKMMEKKRKKI